MIRTSWILVTFVVGLFAVTTAQSGFAADPKLLSADEVRTLYAGNTISWNLGGESARYYVTYKEDNTTCDHDRTKGGDCVGSAPWWMEENAICIDSSKNGVFCWTTTKTDENEFYASIVRVGGGGTDPRFIVGTGWFFRMEAAE